MAKEKGKRDALNIPQMPFEVALKRIMSAPPQPKIRKKSKRALSKRTK